ncbi:MAG: replication factor C large subunit [archaeon]|nr:replication factor C large subunit [archaeon]
MGADWTEKYRPQTLKDIVGNPGPATAMKQWAESWTKGIPEKRALVLIGSPGIGKTSSAEALAREMGWGLLEMNASDQRTGDAIKSVATKGSRFNTFDADGSYRSTGDGGRKLIVLDEADSLYGNSDRGAMPVINDLIRNTSQPLILIVNDFYALQRKSAAVKNDTLQITFRKPLATAIEKALRKICDGEGIECEEGVLAKVAANANGDLRAAVRDLQSLSPKGGLVTLKQAMTLSGRETRSDIFALVDAVYRKKDTVRARRLLAESDTDPETLSLWLDENMPYECHTKGDLVRCNEKLSKADIFLSRVKRRQYYGLWSYANDMMIDGVIGSLESDRVTYDRIRFPSYLTKMSRSKATRAVRNSLASKIGRATHTSAASILAGELDLFRTTAIQDEGFCVHLIKTAELTDEEVGFLIGEKMDSKKVKTLMATAFPDPEKDAPKKTTRSRKKTADDGAAEAPKTRKRTVRKAEEPAPAPVVKTVPPVAETVTVKTVEETKVKEPTPVVEATVAEPAEKPVEPVPEKTVAKKPAATKAAKPIAKGQRSLFDF